MARTRPLTGGDRLAGWAAGVVVAVLVLAPLAAPGYALLYDMVFVPRQPLTWELVAPVESLPRAVPLDAVVSVATQVVPGWLVQRLALGGALLFAAVGAGLLVPAGHRLTRLAAAVGYAWTPYLAERLLIGQWGLLLAYAALPWIVRAALAARRGLPGALPRLVLAAAPAALTPTGGLIALAVVAVLLPVRWRSVVAVTAVALLNAPWAVAATVSGAGGVSDPAGVDAFAARAENWAGPLVALAGTGGIWSAQATPASRSSPLVPVATLVLLVLAGVGFGVLRRRLPPGAAGRWALLAAGGFLLAALGVLPGTDAALRWAVAHLPGVGLLRDGQKFLIPYALLLVVCAVLGAERLVAGRQRSLAAVALGGLVLFPVAVMPDLAVGGAGRLRPVHYPAEWDRVAATVAAEPGEVLALPLSAYRVLPWNPGRVVLDPLPRYLPARVLTDDTLQVSDIVVTGESPRIRGVRRLLAEGRPATEVGVRWVVVQHSSAGAVDPAWLVGLQKVHEGPLLTVYRNPAAGPRPDATSGGRWAVVAALGAALLVVLTATILTLRRRPTAW